MKELRKMHQLFLFGGYIKRGKRERVGEERKIFLQEISTRQKKDESMRCSSMGERRDRKGQSVRGKEKIRRQVRGKGRIRQ
jgi:hypothetical protein